MSGGNLPDRSASDAICAIALRVTKLSRAFFGPGGPPLFLRFLAITGISTEACKGYYSAGGNASGSVVMFLSLGSTVGCEGAGCGPRIGVGGGSGSGGGGGGW